MGCGGSKDSTATANQQSSSSGAKAEDKPAEQAPAAEQTGNRIQTLSPVKHSNLFTMAKAFKHFNLYLNSFYNITIPLLSYLTIHLISPLNNCPRLISTIPI